MDNLQYIEVAKIHPNPGNPRKDLGDLTELADSIKAQGILQNLTVVPGHRMTREEFADMAKAEGSTKAAARALYDSDPSVGDSEDGYMVIIGHRRLAAAALAGLDKVPCVVVDMDEKKQARTMLMENMHRSNLTVYEQAQGFQMMLNLGDTVKDIAQQAGFSAATVRSRVKLLELDPKKFKKSEERGATIQDYVELEKIEDPDLKNEVLDTIGTNNFKNALQSAMEKEKLNKALAKWEAEVSTFAQKIKKQGKVNGVDVPMDFYQNLNKWCLDKEVVRPEDADTVKYYYTISDREIYIYHDHKERKKTPEDIQREEQEREEKRIRGELTEISERHRSLRYDFISSYGAAKKNLKTIMQFMATAIIVDAGNWISANDDTLYGLLGFEIDDDTMDDDLEKMAKEAVNERPEYSLLACAYAIADDTNENYWYSTWSSEQRRTIFLHHENPNLDRIYDFLISLGYQMSDEEKAMRDGTHELFKAMTAADSDAT